MANMCAVFSMGDINLLHPDKAIEVLRKKVNRTISSLQHTFPQAKEEYPALKQKLRTLGVMPENVYMYIRGHDIFDAVVSPLVSSVCEMLRRERERNPQTCHKRQTVAKRIVGIPPQHCAMRFYAEETDRFLQRSAV